MDESVIVPAPDSVLRLPLASVDMDADDLSILASTPRNPKENLKTATPKSILKRKLDCAEQSPSKRMRVAESSKSKKFKLSLPKIRRRKSLINSFSDISSEQRQGDVEGSIMGESVSVVKDCENANESVNSSVVKESENVRLMSESNALFAEEESTIPYYNATLSPLSPKEHKLTNASIKNGKDLSSNENNLKNIIEISNSPLMKDVDDHKNKRLYRIKSFLFLFLTKMIFETIKN